MEDYEIKKYSQFPDTTVPDDAEVANGNMDAFLKIFGLHEDTFSSSETYALNEFVVYKHMLWRCTTPVTTAGAWTGETNWIQDSILVPSED